jgi:hypothetical protein
MHVLLANNALKTIGYSSTVPNITAALIKIALTLPENKPSAIHFRSV